MKFSIIIPIHKECINLEKCLDSIHIQTYKNYEIIVIYNESDIEINRILNRYKEIKKVNNKNEAINISSGEYIFFIDCNDYLELNTLSILEKSSKNNPDIVRFQIRLADIELHEKVMSEISFKTCDGKKALNNIVKYKCVYNAYLYIFNSKYIKDNNFVFENRYNEDFMFVTNSIYNASSVLSIGDILYNHLIDNKKVDYEILKNEAYDTYYFGNKLLDIINDIEIKSYISREIISKCSKLKKDDYKDMVNKIKTNNLIDILYMNKFSLGKILYNISIKLAVRLIKW